MNKQTIRYIIIKCLTIAQIKQELSKYEASVLEELVKTKTNPMEYEDYLQKTIDVGSAKFYLDVMKEAIDDDDPEYEQYCKDIIKKYSKDIFNYERRVVENFQLPTNSSLDVDISKYKIDTNGDLEKAQIDSNKNIDLSLVEEAHLKEYFMRDYLYINGKIYNTDFWKKLSKDEKFWWDDEALDNETYILDKAINKSNGVLEDSMYFRGGYWDIHLQVGDEFTWDGYTSLSYDPDGVNTFINHDNERYIRVLINKGKKGIPANLNGMAEYDYERELLIGRQTKGKVVSYTNDMVTVIIEE